MAKMNTKYRYMLDNAPASTLLAKGAPATASFNGVPLVLDKVGGWWNDPHYLADTVVAIAINVETIDATTGDETYKLELEFGDDTFTKTVKTHSVTVTGPGQYVVLVDAETVMAMLPTVNAVRLNGVLAGTTPSIVAYAWIAGRPIL